MARNHPKKWNHDDANTQGREIRDADEVSCVATVASITEHDMQFQILRLKGPVIRCYNDSVAARDEKLGGFSLALVYILLRSGSLSRQTD